MEPPRGITGHLRYSLRLAWRLRGLRQRIEAIEDELWAAVEARDRALTLLGEVATRVGLEEGRSAEFAETVRADEADAALAVGALEAGEAELAAAREERAEMLAAAKVERARLKGEIAPLSEALAGARRRLGAAEQAQAGAARAPSEDPAEADAPTDESAEAQGAQAISEAEVTARAEEIERLQGEVSALAARVRRAQGHLDEARQEHEEARRAVDARVAELDASVHVARTALEAAGRRRAATLSDLGRELIHRPGLPKDVARAQEDAVRALSRLEALRAERASVLGRRAALDEGPMWRTLAAVAVVLAAGVVLYALL